MRFLAKTFWHDDSGAVTVDWVVLTAAVVGLAMAAIVSIQGSTGSAGATVGNALAERPVGGEG
jgi:hypothetical protein